MTYEFAMEEASRRQRVLGKNYAVCMSQLWCDQNGYMVIPLVDAEQRDLLIVQKLIIN